MANNSLLVFHLVASVITNYMVYWCFTCVVGKPYIDVAVQITVITLNLLNVYYLIALFQDFQALFGKKPIKNGIPYGDKTYLLFQTVFSMAHLVSVAYWALRLKDIRLVVPEKELSAVDWRSSYVHGLHLIPMYIELVVFIQTLPKKRLWKMIHFTEITVTYIFLQFVYNKLTGKQVYPFLADLPLYIVGAFYGCLFLFMLSVDVWGSFLISSLHRPKIVDEVGEKAELLVKGRKGH